MIFGIDLGTTNSLITYLDNGVPRAVPNALGTSTTWCWSGKLRASA